MSDLKQAMSEVYGNWEATRRAGGEDAIVIQELGDLRGLHRIQEEAFEVETEVKKSAREFKVRKIWDGVGLICSVEDSFPICHGI